MTNAKMLALAERIRELTKNQRRLVMALPDNRAKKWRAQYRHAKVRGWTQLPFDIARPTLTGSEVLTDFGRQVKAALRARATKDREAGGCTTQGDRE